MTDESNDRRQAPEQKARQSDGTDTGAATDSAGARADTDGGKPVMPKPTFSTFVLSMASSTLVHLGEVPDPSTGKASENISLAKHGIDILTMLQDKILNGLDKDEARLLDGLLYELRMKYVVKK